MYSINTYMINEYLLKIHYFIKLEFADKIGNLSIEITVQKIILELLVFGISMYITRSETFSTFEFFKKFGGFVA